MKAQKTRAPQSCADQAKMTVESNDRVSAGFVKAPTKNEDRSAASDVQKTDTPSLSHTSADLPTHLSARAENVLKELASELTGESPPQGRWVPSDMLLEQLTCKHLTTARNCGPQTTAEIIRWAHTRGKIIKPSYRIGRSLAAMWQDAITRFSSGQIAKAEVAEVLEKSTRRRNTRIPVEFQKMLLQLINSSNN